MAIKLALVALALALSGCADYDVKPNVPMAAPSALPVPAFAPAKSRAPDAPWGPKGPTLWSQDDGCFWAHWNSTACQGFTSLVR